ncbi:MAG TPA: ATP-binding protein [Caulobacteraceae bacterium]|nr:ATP-binding protein [Caulobacteraceae bacterium]
MPSDEKRLVEAGAWKASAWFLQNSLDAFVGVRDGELAWANNTWCAITGWSLAQSTGRPYSDFLLDDAAAVAMAKVDDLPLGAQTTFTHRVAAEAGSWRWLQHHAVRGGDGWVLMILRDVTAERQREIDNEEARRVSSLVRSTAGVTPWRYDAEADRYEIDPNFTGDGDHDGADVRTGQSQRETIHPDDVLAVTQQWHRSLSTGAAGEVEYRMRDGDGSPWRRTRVAWQGVRQRPSGRWDIVGVSADITEIAEARDAALRGEQAAKTAAEAKSRFLANISHEIRTPMNGVLGVLHLIEAEPAEDERRRLVSQALAAGVGLSDLLNDIIDFSDGEAGRLTLAAEPIDPTDQLAHVVAMFRPLAEAKGVALEVEPAADIGWVAADPARLRKLFFHLVSNAVKFTHQGRIRARLAAAGTGEARRLRLEVEDTGVGIAPEARADVFQHFTQADSSVTRRYGGPGLGLAVTRRLAELMGGTVDFSSRPGEGSTFWVEIAAPAAAAPGAPLEPDDGGWLAGVRVLVVEDNPTNRLVATRMLGQLGADVKTADNGAEGVAAMEAEDFDLVFMDIQMPVMDGVEATKRIRALPGPKRLAPIIATTANVMPDQLASYRACGIDGVVAKPISPAALLNEVARLANAA